MASTLRCLGLCLAVVGLGAAAADAASLTITPDQASYQVGDFITLNIVGDSMGGSAYDVFGQLTWEGSIATGVSSSQSQLTSFGGALSWSLGSLPCSTDYCTAFNQIATLTLMTVDQPLYATVTLQAIAPGTLHVGWDESTLSFFGLTSAPGVTIPVPEPAAAALVAAGLAALALQKRRHARS